VLSTDSGDGLSTEIVVGIEDRSMKPLIFDEPAPLSPVPVLLFAKCPIPGRVKTRLAGVVGAQGAAELARALLLDSLERFGGDRGEQGDPLLLLGDRPDLETFLDEGGLGGAAERIATLAQYRPQGEGSLGARLLRAFRSAPLWVPGAQGAVAIGADAPHLDPGALRAAAMRVRDGASVLGPAEDGGYYLVGVSCDHPRLEALFPDTGGGGPGVLAHARAVLESPSQVQQGKEVGPSPVHAELQSLFDIDEEEDLTALADLLREGAQGRSEGTSSAMGIDPRLRLPACAAVIERILPSGRIRGAGAGEDPGGGGIPAPEPP